MNTGYHCWHGWFWRFGPKQKHFTKAQKKRKRKLARIARRRNRS